MYPPQTIISLPVQTARMIDAPIRCLSWSPS